MEVLHHKTPGDELAHLRRRVMRKEREISAEGRVVPPRSSLVSECLREYQQAILQAALHPTFRLSEREAAEAMKQMLHHIASGDYEKSVAHLSDLARTRGIKNALSLAERVGDAHLDDRFRLFLIRYVEEGEEKRGESASEPAERAIPALSLAEVFFAEILESPRAWRGKLTELLQSSKSRKK